MSARVSRREVAPLGDDPLLVLFGEHGAGRVESRCRVRQLSARRRIFLLSRRVSVDI
jgi:hypothetical protein